MERNSILKWYLWWLLLKRHRHIFVNRGLFDIFLCPRDTQHSNTHMHHVCMHTNTQAYAQRACHPNNLGKLFHFCFSHNRCNNSSWEEWQRSGNHPNSLYIGGINLFIFSPENVLQTFTFVGGIRNVVVRGVQLDSTCPMVDVNTIRGMYSAESTSSRWVKDQDCSQKRVGNAN